MDEDLWVLERRLLRICDKYEIYQMMVKERFGANPTVSQRMAVAKSVYRTLLDDLRPPKNI